MKVIILYKMKQNVNIILYIGFIWNVYIKCFTNDDNCYYSCNSCYNSNEIPNENKHYCVKCLDGYYPYQIQSSIHMGVNCYNLSHYPDGLYFDGDSFKQCDTSCKRCEYSSTYCIRCMDGYVFENEKSNKCVRQSQMKNRIYNKYILNKNKNGIRNKCDISCKSCSKGVDICDECVNGYYKSPIKGDGLCYKEYDNYYIDFIDNKNGEFKPCHQQCRKCISSGTNEMQQCIECYDNKFLFNGNCVDLCPYTHPFNYEGICVDKCPEYTELVNNRKCEKCLPPYYFYKGNCKIRDEPHKHCNSHEFRILQSFCPPNCYCNENNDCISCEEDFELKNDVCSPIECDENCSGCVRDNDGRNKCNSCREGFKPNKYNCIPTECDFYWYKGIHTAFTCTVDSNCPSEYPYLDQVNKQCVNTCNNGKKLYNKTCVSDCPKNSLPFDDGNECLIADDIINLPQEKKNELMKNNSDESSYFLVGNDVFFHYCISDQETECEKNCENLGFTFANVTNCLNALELQTNPPSSPPQYLIVISDLKRNDTTAPQIIYEIYLITDSGEPSKSDTSICYNTKLNFTKSIKGYSQIEYALEIFETYNYSIFNYSKENPFYTDICTQFESEDGYDVLLTDRYKHYYKRTNMSFCEKGCKLKEFKLNTSQVVCECMNLQNTRNLVEFIPYNTQQNLFPDRPMQHIKCFNLAFKLSILQTNVGFYIMLFVLLSEIVICCYLQNKGFREVYRYMRNKIKINADTAEITKELEIEEEESEINVDKIIDEHIINNSIGNMNSNSLPNITDNNNSNNLPKSNPPKKKSKGGKTKKKEKNSKVKETTGEDYAKMFVIKQNYVNENNNNNNNAMNNQDNIDDISSDSEEGSDKHIYERNQHANYNNKAKYLKDPFFAKEIVRYPQTSYCYAYRFYIKNKHHIVSLFFNKEIYEIFTFKFSLVIFSLAIDLFFGCMLCYNGYISSLFNNKTHYRIGIDIGLGIAGAVLSYILLKIIREILEYKTEFKKYKEDEFARIDRKEFFGKLNKMIRNLNTRMSFYYLFIFLFIIFDLYFVTSFCATYPNTVRTWGIQIVVNILFSFFFPFLYYAIGVLFLYCGLKKMNESVYKFGLFMLKA